MTWLDKAFAYKQTENAGTAYNTSGDSLLDFFALAGSMRKRSDEDIISLFMRAYNQDKLLAFKALFYLRDIRKGVGERKAFKVILEHLGNQQLLDNIDFCNLVLEYGRVDDLLPLLNTKYAEIVAVFLHDNIKNPLVAKWMPSINTSSKKTREYAKKIISILDITPVMYRKFISEFRKDPFLVEHNLTKKDYSFDYQHVPSKAHLKYKKAFFRNDDDRYTQYLSSVQKGTAKMNTGTLMACDIVSKYMKYYRVLGNIDSTLEVAWKELLDRYKDIHENGICVVDVSGSMFGQPINVAISLGLFYATLNKGPFNNRFITFSNKPTIQTVQGDSFHAQISALNNADWDMNTNIEAVFLRILEFAKQHNVSQDDMPKRVYIVSDMEFDRACRVDESQFTTLFEALEQKFVDNGYQLPKLVFWNVDNRNDTFPVQGDSKFAQFVSGFSQNVFMSILEHGECNAIEMMNKVLLSKRYEPVRFLLDEVEKDE